MQNTKENTEVKRRESVPIEVIETIQYWLEQIEDPSELTQMEKNILSFVRKWTNSASLSHQG